MSSFDDLRREAYEANAALPKLGIVYFTWGNVSVFDPGRGAVAIKPSGVAYEKLRAEDIVVTDLHGKILECALNPSSDLQTHLELYKNFEGLRAVVHTHSLWACGWAQAGLDIPCLGTTHADCFYGPIPCTRALSDAEIQTDYELNTGKVIAETFRARGIDPLAVPGVLVKNHGPFAWAQSASKAVENAATLEIVANMSAVSLQINPAAKAVPQALADKHYFRKHGKDAYYGQK